MKYILLLIFLFGLMVLAVFGFGYFYHDNYSGKIEFDIEVPTVKVYQYITSVEDFPRTHKEVNAIDVLRFKEGKPATWKAIRNDGSVAVFALIEDMEQKQWTVQMLNSTMGMSGTWNYYFSGNERYCHLVIIENSSIEEYFYKAWYHVRGRDYFLQHQKENILNFFDGK